MNFKNNNISGWALLFGTVLGLGAGLTAQASPESEKAAFVQALSQLSEKYQNLGSDNNYMAVKLNPQYPLDAFSHRPLRTFSELKTALLECGLIGEGAYGEHLSLARRVRLAQAGAGHLLKAAESTSSLTYFHRVENWGVDASVINSSCGIYIEVGYSFTLGLSSHSFD